MIAKWKLWGAAVAGFIALWLLAFVSVWHARTRYQVDWRAAVNDWFGDFVTLGWVYHYQTLVAGLLAAFAALALFANSSIERHRRIKDAEAERRARLLETISALELSMRRLGVLVINDASTTRIDRVAAQIELQCAAITHEAAPLANAVMYAFSALENDKTDEDLKAALAWAGAYCLRQPTRYFQTGTFKLHKLELSEEDQLRIRSLRGTDKERYQHWMKMPA